MASVLSWVPLPSHATPLYTSRLGSNSALIEGNLGGSIGGVIAKPVILGLGEKGFRDLGLGVG